MALGVAPLTIQGDTLAPRGAVYIIKVTVAASYSTSETADVDMVQN